MMYASSKRINQRRFVLIEIEPGEEA